MIKSSGLEPEASLEIAQLPGMLGRGGGEGGGSVPPRGPGFSPQIKVAHLPNSECRSLSPPMFYTERRPSKGPGTPVLSDQTLLQKRGASSAQRPSCPSEGGKPRAFP